MTTYILYHGRCPDGFGAAYAAWKFLGDTAKYIPVSHGELPPQLPLGATVFIVDFAYHRDILLKMRQQHHVTVIDHHKTAQQDLAGLDIANATIAGSDVAHLLCKRFPEALFVAIYFDSGGKRFWTLTSEGKFDVSSIAQKYGGGGHANAAGFREILFPELNADSAMPSISLLPLF